MYIYIKIQIIFYLMAVAFLMLGVPFIVSAGSVSVTSSVSSSANSGGNTVEGGEVTEGNSFSNVSVKTVINGEVVTDYSKSSESENGDSAEAHVYVQTEVDDAGVSTKVDEQSETFNDVFPDFFLDILTEENPADTGDKNKEDTEQREILEGINSGKFFHSLSTSNFFSQLFSYVFKLF